VEGGSPDIALAALAAALASHGIAVHARGRKKVPNQIAAEKIFSKFVLV
jgi:hypothetical protein